MNNYDEGAKLSAKWHKENIIPIPDGCIVDKFYLGTMTNGEFVSAFKELQNAAKRVYEEIEKDPFAWGYPQGNTSTFEHASAYRRITDFLYAAVSHGELKDGKLTVDGEGFRKAIHKHKKTEMIAASLQKIGFNIERYDKKVVSFTFSYIENPRVIEALYYFAKAQDLDISPVTTYRYTFAGFSYRWIEDPNQQKYETIFHVIMDLSSGQTQKIQFWLHEKADEYGYKIEKKKPFDKGCVYYKKGTKEFIHAGEKIIDGKGEKPVTFAKVIFRNVLSSHSDRISLLAKKIPGVFGERNKGICIHCKKDQPCSMRIPYDFEDKQYENCAFRSFEFYDFTYDVFKDIFELFLIEMKIKLESIKNAI